MKVNEKFKDTQIGSLRPYDIIQLLTNSVKIQPESQQRELSKEK